MSERASYPRNVALDVAYTEFFYPFKDYFPEIKCVIAGSIRREKESVHDIDILIVSRKPEIMEWCRNKLINNKGLLYYSGQLKTIQTQIWFCNPEEYGPSLLKWTGPQRFNRALCIIAKNMGGTLSEFGLFKGSPDNRGIRIDENTEANIIWLILHKKWIHPRDRY